MPGKAPGCGCDISAGQSSGVVATPFVMEAATLSISGARAVSAASGVVDAPLWEAASDVGADTAEGSLRLAMMIPSTQEWVKGAE